MAMERHPTGRTRLPSSPNPSWIAMKAEALAVQLEQNPNDRFTETQVATEYEVLCQQIYRVIHMLRHGKVS